MAIGVRWGKDVSCSSTTPTYVRKVPVQVALIIHQFIHAYEPP